MINTLDDIMFTNGVGVLYLDESQNIVSANGVAKRILDDGKALRRLGQKLVFADSSLRSKVLACIRTLSSTEFQESIFIKRNVDEPPVRVNIYPYSDDLTDSSGIKPSSVLLVSDMSLQPKLCSRSIKEFFSLTKAELALVESLALGLSLQQHAERRGVKVTTVRWTLENVFSKTYKRSQGELIDLIRKFSI